MLFHQDHTQIQQMIYLKNMLFWCSQSGSFRLSYKGINAATLGEMTCTKHKYKVQFVLNTQNPIGVKASWENHLLINASWEDVSIVKDGVEDLKSFQQSFGWKIVIFKKLTMEAKYLQKPGKNQNQNQKKKAFLGSKGLDSINNQLKTSSTGWSLLVI